MPEGPEIRRAADKVAHTIEGKRLDEVFFGLPRLRKFAGQLRDARVVSIETRGKAMLTHFDNDLTLFTHNQLYGRWYVSRRNERPETNRDLRVALHSANGTAWLYSASDIAVLSSAKLAAHPYLSKLGPDVLDASVTVKQLSERLNDQRFRRRSLAALYLDQRFLAGIGNYLRSEILFAAGVHAADRPQDLSPAERRRLASESLKLSLRSYRSGGITLPARLTRELKSSGATFGEYRFWVFGRDGKRCRYCGTRIERTDFGGRGLYSCESCQPRRR